MGVLPICLNFSLRQYDYHFMKKVPPGAETSNILVGETDFLSTPLIVFLRLKEAILLDGMTEVPVPTRFIFILLGTPGNAAKYKEIGRSMATLMSDEVSIFCCFFICKEGQDLFRYLDP
ncbi:unnamed protein product [Protopolystoma xenopodis]|uniref:Band 3 cytoplasmic domain-containing protein n=1 Tax=Protopolystoma xenopodis TaxID=117903 RepID=A0A448X9P6_9PLAT|nr:unnamed protein product [Protopolystoma xenopodis]